jgi:hypothetical protein
LKCQTRNIELNDMRIKNIDGLSATDLQQEVNNGGRFVYYPYTISLLFVTMKRTSGVYLVKAGSSDKTRRLPYMFMSALLGWWGFPFGPLYTMESLRTNYRGGKDVTDDIMDTVAGFLLFKETEKEKASGQ